MTALQFTVILSSFIWWNHVVSRPVTQLLSSTNLVNAVSFVERFIALSFIPSDTDFFFFYLPPPFSWLRHGIPLLLLIGAVATMVYRLRRPVLFLLGAALFVAPTLPVILILDRGERINERYFYLPWLGFCLMAAAGIYSWSQKRKTTLSVPWKKWITVAGTFWMIALAVFTILRNREWKDEVTLFQSSAERNPKNWQPYYHLAHHYRRTGETEKMLASYQEVLVRNPRHRGTANNLAVFYTERRDWERARFWLQALLKIAPDSPMTAYNFGVYYENRSEPAEAARWYQKALALNPDYIKARDGRSRVLRK
jgi:hypothetical protein